MYRYRPPCYHATTTVLIPRPYIGQQSILLPLLLHHAIMQHPASSAVGGGSNFRFGTAWDTCVSFETLETPLGHMCLIWDTLGTLWDTSWDTCLNDRQNFTNRVSCGVLYNNLSYFHRGLVKGSMSALNYVLDVARRRSSFLSPLKSMSWSYVGFYGGLTKPFRARARFMPDR